MLPIFHNLLNQGDREDNRELRLYRRQLRDNSNPFGIPENRFVELFRLSKNTARHLINTLVPHLAGRVRRSGISTEIKILVALRFFATGEYQRSIGEDFHFGMSQTSAHRCIHEVTSAICIHMADNFIKFPQILEERNRIKLNFMNAYGFPGVVGAIDGAHVAILKPTTQEHNFMNRKGFHSLNVQVICDSNLKFLNINPNYGGASHDAFIWRHSNIKAYLSQLYDNGENCYLLGDSGYPLQPYLLTPVLNAIPNTPESNYNAAHARSRNVVERAIGLLKMRFRCVLKERTARYEPRFVADLVTASAVLHNMCVRNDYHIEDIEVDDIRDNYHNNDNDLLFNFGREMRNNVIQRYFQ